MGADRGGSEATAFFVGDVPAVAATDAHGSVRAYNGPESDGTRAGRDFLEPLMNRKLTGQAFDRRVVRAGSGTYARGKVDGRMPSPG